MYARFPPVSDKCSDVLTGLNFSRTTLHASHNNKLLFDYHFAAVLKIHPFSDVSEYRLLIGALPAMRLELTTSSNRSVSSASYTYSSRAYHLL